MPQRAPPARKKDEGDEERFHRGYILALRLTGRRLAIILYPGESAALKARRRSDREFDQRLMREVLRSLNTSETRKQAAARRL